MLLREDASVEYVRKMRTKESKTAAAKTFWKVCQVFWQLFHVFLHPAAPLQT